MLSYEYDKVTILYKTGRGKNRDTKEMRLVRTCGAVSHLDLYTESLVQI